MKKIVCLLLALLLMLCTACDGSSNPVESELSISEEPSVIDVPEDLGVSAEEAHSGSEDATESSDLPVLVENTPSPEDDDMSITLFRASVVSSLGDSFGQDFTIDEDRANYSLSVSLWSDGVFDLADSAKNGDVESVIAWKDFSSSFTDLSTAFLNIADMLNLSHYTIICNYLSDIDQESVLLSTVDGAIVFDYVPADVASSAMESAGEYAFATDEEKYTAAQDALKVFVQEHPGAVLGGYLNLDSYRDGHPSFSVIINYYSEYDSIYDFQNLVCDTLDELQNISDEYYIQYNDISIFFRAGDYGSNSTEDAYIEYHVVDTENMYIGNITDEYNHVNGYDISADQINTWYAGDDFSTKVAEANAPCTYDEYLQIETGMSYDEVVAIIGTDGEEMSSASVGGSTAKVYQWDGDKKYSNVVIEFLNGAVISKAQTGLD